MKIWISESFIKGIQAMPNQINFFKPQYWSIDLHKSKLLWLHLWTPKWHKERGPYITFGFYFIRIIRGY